MMCGGAGWKPQFVAGLVVVALALLWSSHSVAVVEGFSTTVSTARPRYQQQSPQRPPRVIASSGFPPTLSLGVGAPSLGFSERNGVRSTELQATASSYASSRRGSRSARSSVAFGGGGEASSSSSNPVVRIWKSRTARQVRSASLFLLVDIAFRYFFQRYGVAFPPSLGGCAALLTLLLVLPRQTSDSLHRRLEPGAALLAKWLPVMFVPSLVTLPLADGLGSALEWTKVSLVVGGGFVASLWSTAASVVAIRKLARRNEKNRFEEAAGSINRFIASAEGTLVVDDDKPLQSMSDKVVQFTETKQRLGRPGYSRASLRRLAILSVVSGIASWVVSALPQAGWPSALFPPLRLVSGTLLSLSLWSTTLASFVYGSRLPKKVTSKIHPLVTCTLLTWTVVCIWSQLLGRSFASILKRFYRGGHHSMSTYLAAGDLLLFGLGPAVVSLASSVYGRRQLVRNNAGEVATAVAVSTTGGLFGTAFAVRLLQLGNPYLRLALLSRNLTSPLAMALAGMLGADVSLAVSMVVVTGLLGANFGPSLLNLWNIRDPVARGLGMGAAAHGLGTAALAKDESEAFPFAALSMALTGSVAVAAVSLPTIRNLLVQLALGA